MYPAAVLPAASLRRTLVQVGSNFNNVGGFISAIIYNMEKADESNAVQVCDATMIKQRTTAGSQKNKKTQATFNT